MVPPDIPGLRSNVGLQKASCLMGHGWRIRIILAGGLALVALQATGQIDPVRRELVQFGYNQPMQGHPPLSGYAFYYRNTPNFHWTNVTLRLAVAPVYMDSEVGLSHALGANTDLGIGLAGGGFADSYSEIRGGKFVRDESFIGHGAEGSLSAYHLFNPGALIPLYGVLRVAGHYATYDEEKHTADNFVLPPDQETLRVRTGLRWGGHEPLMRTELAMELSAWYEAEFRAHPESYGFSNDREIEPRVHLFWGRAMLAYTFEKSKQAFDLSLTVGSSINSDRFSAYRLGGVLPLVSEFPLMLPGYYFQEISARTFAVLAGDYTFPLGPNQRWAIVTTAGGAVVDYTAGLEQPGNWHSGVGGGILYRSPTDSWQLLLGYGYGIEAIRDGDRGAHSIGFLLQFDLGRTKQRLFDPGENPIRSRGLQRMFQIFR
jgi:hypothetical protein